MGVIDTGPTVMPAAEALRLATETKEAQQQKARDAAISSQNAWFDSLYKNIPAKIEQAVILGQIKTEIEMGSNNFTKSQYLQVKALLQDYKVYVKEHRITEYWDRYVGYKLHIHFNKNESSCAIL